MRVPIALFSLVSASIATALVPTRSAHAAPPWVDRPLTLPSGDWAFDFGLGVAHAPADVPVPVPVPLSAPAPADAVVGANAEMAVGITSRVEIGVRTGVRFGDLPSRALNADDYGRLFDRQTLPPGAEGAEVLANPEVRVRGALVREEIVELALEGRVVLPFADGTDAGMLFGMPLAFHLGDRVRLDTGVYVPVIFYPHDTSAGLSAPIDVWIQATRRFWLGPMSGVAIDRLGDNRGTTRVSLGFGLGYQIAHAVDLKGMVLFPEINDESRDFGFGVGVQVRIE